MKRSKNLLLIILLFTASQIVYSAPINLPSSIEDLEGQIWSHEFTSSPIEISAGIEIDFVTKRELDELEAEVKGNFYTAKLLFLGTEDTEKFDWYVNFGQAQDIEYKTAILGSDVKFDLEDEFVWGLGVSYAFTSKDDSLQIGIDAKYRQIRGMDYNSVTINDIAYSKSQLGGKLDAKWKEWQVALLIGKEFDYFIPYVGIKYSDVDASAKVIISGTTYDAGSTDSENKFGMFVGCSITPIEQISIELQGRFIDEEAFTVGILYKF